jgi:hypothetical protein
MKRYPGLLLVVALLACSAACSVTNEEGSHPNNDDVRNATTHRQTPVTKGHADDPATWTYVALGDSLAAGVDARRGYVERYAAHIESDTGARVEVLNLGVSGLTSSELLYALRNDESMRRALSTAEVVTFNIGINVGSHSRRALEPAITRRHHHPHNRPRLYPARRRDLRAVRS